MTGLGRRAATVVAACLALAVVFASPASADPAGPTDYRSEVRELVPSTDAVAVDVVGGDAFLRLDVEPGHEVEVLGYEGEPYLRVLEDGTVQVNRRSPAAYLNEDRFGQVDVPADADPEAEPEWEDVADGGTYLWHDHRVHYMGAGLPPTAADQPLPARVQTWTLDLLVDGEEVEVRGELVLHGSPSPLPWIALCLLAAAGVVGFGRRRPVAVTAGALACVSAGAVLVGWSEWSSVPSYVRPSPLVVLVPVGALVAAGGAIALRRSPAGAVADLLSGGLVLGWVLLRFSVLTARFLPGPLPPDLDRAVVAVAGGVALASVGLLLWSGAFRPTLPDEVDAAAPA